MGTVINFPNIQEDVTKATTMQGLANNIHQYRMGYIEEVSEFLLTIVLNEITRAGFALEEDDSNEVQLMFESIKAIMMKKNGYEHPLHDISSDIDNYIETSELGDS